MSEIENLKKSIIYLDEKQENFSNIAIGKLITAIGDGKRIAYIDINDNSTKFTNFLENLSLSYSFIKTLRFHLEIYKFKQNNKITKTIIPQVEFSAIDTEMFWHNLDRYNLIIFDNFDLKNINKIHLIGFLKNKTPTTKVILIANNKRDYETIKDNFNTKIIVNYKHNNSLVVKKGLINIIGNGEGKTSYSIGYLIKKFISKNDVKLIYFDKGDNIYGDAIFFDSLKKWAKENNMYGRLDFVKTGIKRITQSTVRQTKNELDTKEAKDALMLLKTSLKKQSPVIADELNNMIEKQILSLKEVLEVINETKEELVITGKTSPKQILDISENIIEIIQ